MAKDSITVTPFSGARVQLAIAKAFDSIGSSTKDTVMPTAKRNTEPAAWELFVASKLCALANSRLKAAKEAAEAAGLIERTEEVGETTMYNGEFVNIIRIVKNPSNKFNKIKAGVELQKLGVPTEKIEKAWDAATEQNAAPNEFKAVTK